MEETVLNSHAMGIKHQAIMTAHEASNVSALTQTTNSSTISSIRQGTFAVTKFKCYQQRLYGC